MQNKTRKFLIVTFSINSLVTTLKEIVDHPDIEIHLLKGTPLESKQALLEKVKNRYECILFERMLLSDHLQQEITTLFHKGDMPTMLKIFSQKDSDFSSEKMMQLLSRK